VVWKHWLDHELVLVSYGVSKPEVAPIDRSIAPLFKESLIRSYVNRFKGTSFMRGCKKYGLDVTWELNFNKETGIGFIRVRNYGEKYFELNL